MDENQHQKNDTDMDKFMKTHKKYDEKHWKNGKKHAENNEHTGTTTDGNLSKTQHKNSKEEISTPTVIYSRACRQRLEIYFWC